MKLTAIFFAMTWDKKVHPASSESPRRSFVQVVDTILRVQKRHDNAWNAASQKAYGDLPNDDLIWCIELNSEDSIPTRASTQVSSLGTYFVYLRVQISDACANQAWIWAEQGEKQSARVASFVLAIHFTNPNFCNSWCPLRSDVWPKKHVGKV